MAAAGVKVGLGIPDTDLVRNLIWEAGIASARGLDRISAIASVTSVPAQLFGIYNSGVGLIRIGQTANFVAYSSDPLSIQSYVQFIAVGTSVQCLPQQL